ncbi:hypothetical protein Bbelb_285490 [Branchiostoma belcheri]|nr:hypothetical protein Bbelb_285490 [Branchiostoma belcheri]
MAGPCASGLWSWIVLVLMVTTATVSGQVIDGVWSDWGPWLGCFGVCGEGTQTRERTCTNPSPGSGTAYCGGQTKQLQQQRCDTGMSCIAANVALGKPTNQTATRLFGGAASRAVDGNTATLWYYQSCTQTPDVPANMVPNPSWWVDLGQSYMVGSVVVFNRQDDCCWQRINPFNLHIGDSDKVTENPQCGANHVFNVNQPYITISCRGMQGRYVGIRLIGPARVLTLCEVQVYPVNVVAGVWSDWGPWLGCFGVCGEGTQTRERICTNPSPGSGTAYCGGQTKQLQQQRCDTGMSCTAANVALGKPTNQTATRLFGGAASRAVDGNTATLWYYQSCTQTPDVPANMVPNPSWWVDLGQSYMVGSVVVFNRQDDGAWQRINPFNLHIGDSDKVTENPQCGANHVFNVNQPYITISCRGMQGRYVGIRLIGPARVLTLCEVQVYPVNVVAGVWSDWGPWLGCFGVCGEGTQTRERTCTNPSPGSGTAYCGGQTKQLQQQRCDTGMSCTAANVALGKPTNQTSTRLFGGAASRAVDGNTATLWYYQSCTQTPDVPANMVPNPSWWVDLGQSYMVGSVVVFNRQDDCCWQRINPFNLHIGDSDKVTENPQCGANHVFNVNQPYITISCRGMQGRYVGIRLIGPARVLTLCEVQVYPVNVVAGVWSDWGPWLGCFGVCGEGTQTRERTCTNPSPGSGTAYCGGQTKQLQQQRCDTGMSCTAANVALGKPTNQTSTRLFGGAASRAVDGNTATLWYYQSCTQTPDVPANMVPNPSWWVDLGQSYMVGSVVVFNRQDDCCWQRINPFNLHIGDSDKVTENPQCGANHVFNVNQPYITISCRGMQGRYVGIRLIGPARVLTLCEVQVYPVAVGGPPSAAVRESVGIARIMTLLRKSNCTNRRENSDTSSEQVRGCSAPCGLFVYLQGNVRVTDGQSYQASGKTPRHRLYKMWFYRLVVLTAVLTGQWSVGTAEDRPDQFSLSLCKLWEDCVKTVEVAETGKVAKLQTVCQDVADMLETSDVQNCGSLLSGGEEKQANNEHHPQPFLASLALGMFGRTNYFTDCSQIHTALAMFNDVTSGEHDIKPLGMSSPISVYCDQTTDGGGWTVIQRRFDGSLHFDRPYNDYRYGFGSADGEQWLGLEPMYHLTYHNAYELYIELEDWSGVVKYALYDSFSVGDSSTNYRLNVGGYSGTAGDGFDLSRPSSGLDLNGQGFSARNVDHDASSGSCAGNSLVSGGWWYNSCGYSALNGPYLRPSDRTSHSAYGVYWQLFGGSDHYYLKKSKMMIRPSDFQP